MPDEIPMSFDPPEFDQWAKDYDEETTKAEGFPFEGYSDVLDEIIHCAHVSQPVRVLDIGTGTGNLALRFFALGCTVWGTDFSTAMLEIARAKVSDQPSGITFLHWDLRDPWPDEIKGDFDCIVSAYTLHHFDLQAKLDLLETLGAHLKPGGHMALGDVAFETYAKRDQARTTYGQAWGEEYYWIAEETLPALAQAGWQAAYRQVSTCAGVFCLERTNHV